MHRIVRWISALLLFVPSLAWAPTFFSPGRMVFSALGAPENGSQVYCTDCTEGSDPCTSGGTGAMAVRTNGAWQCLDSGGSGSGTNLLGANTCMVVTGDVTPLFMTTGCLAPSEVPVEQKVKDAITFSNLQCITAIDPGAANSITLTGRSGTCGALSDSGTFICTLTGGSGRAICNTGATTLVLTAGQCWSLKLVPTAGVADTDVSCSLEGA